MQVTKPLIGIAAQRIARGASGFVVNRAAASNVFFGPTSAVTTATGATLKPDEQLSFDLSRTEEIWMIAATDGNAVEVVLD